MHDFIPSNSDIYDWYMFEDGVDSLKIAEDIQLINDFKTAMINSN